MLRQVCQLLQQAGAITLLFTHADNTAAAHFHAGTAHVLQGFEPVPVGAGGNDIAVKFRGRIQVVVVIIEPGFRQLLRLLRAQHAESHAAFQAQFPHSLDHGDHIGHVPLLGRAPGRAHAEPGGATFPGSPRLLQHLFNLHQLLDFQARVIAGALGTVGAVFRTGAGFDGKQSAHLHLIRVKITPMNTLGLEQQVVEGQGEQGLHFLARPVMTYFVGPGGIP